MDFNALILKYNGKELQETGMYSYGWREYMPDIGRWNGIDQLAEAYTSTSTYAYVANNPILMTDPDGRWMDDSGHITDTTGQTFGFHGSSYRPQNVTNYLGVKPGDGGGGDSYNFTGKYALSMFNYFKNKGTMSGLSFGDTEVTWYTGTATQDAYRMGDDIFSNIDLGIIHKAKVTNQSFLDLSLMGNVNDGFGGFAEGLSYNGKNGGKLYIGTARLNKPINLGFTKFYGNGKTYIKPAYMGKVGNVLGKASIAATVIIGGVNIYNGIQQDGGTFGRNATKATTGTVGGAVGAWGGATLGAEIGAGIGVWFGGVGAAPGALIGGVIGGIAGGIIGTKTGEGVIY